MEEISGLVFSRGLSAAEWQQLSRKRRSGEYLKLAPGAYVPMGVFAEAPPWERAPSKRVGGRCERDAHSGRNLSGCSLGNVGVHSR